MMRLLKCKNFLAILLSLLLTLALCACGGKTAEITEPSSDFSAIRSSSTAVSSEVEALSANESSQISVSAADENDDTTDIEDTVQNINTETAESIPDNWISSASEPDSPETDFIEESSEPETSSEIGYQLSDDRKKEILDAYGKFYIIKNAGDLSSFSPEPWERRTDLLRYCIDSYDGNDVVIICDDLGQDFGERIDTIGSYTFDFGFMLSNTPMLFIYYNNSDMILLDDAYDQGVVSDEMLGDIYDKFTTYYHKTGE